MVNEAGPNQKTVDIGNIIQEIVNQPNYTDQSAIGIIIEGFGERTAYAFDSSPNRAAELCVQFELNDAS